LYLVTPERIHNILTRLFNFIDSSYDALDTFLVILDRHLQGHITFRQNLIFFIGKSLPQIAKTFLNLFLACIVLFCNLTNMLLKLRFPTGQPIDITVDILQQILEFSLDYWLTLFESLNVMVFVLSMDNTFRTDALNVAFETIVQ
jgi:hypothetical protein